MKPIPPYAKTALRWGLGLLIIAFLVWGLWKNWGKLSAQGVHISWLPFAFAVFWNLGFFITQAVVWRGGVASLGKPIPYPAAISIWTNSQISKYVPGKVMLLLVRMEQAGRLGVPGAATLVSIYFELMLMIAVTGLLSILLAPMALEKLYGIHINAIFFALPVLVVALGLHPRVLNALANTGLRLLKREPIRMEIPYIKILLMALLLVAGCFCHGLSAIACFKTIGAQGIPSWPLLTGMFAFSWLVGFLSFLTPGGIGVREGVLTALLNLTVPMEIAIAVSLISRLAWVAGEIVLAAIFWKFRPLARDSVP